MSDPIVAAAEFLSAPLAAERGRVGTRVHPRASGGLVNARNDGPVDALVTWLTAQLDDDERIARCVFRSRIRADGRKVMSIDPPGFPDLPVADVIDAPTAEHIARWSCQRVLAELEAKRRILGLHHPVDPCDEHDASMATVPCETLLALAQPHTDRPGFREEWRLAP